MDESSGPFPLDRVVALASKGYSLNPGVLLGRGFHLYQVSRVLPRGPVLDIGCGDGMFGSLLLELLRERDGNLPRIEAGIDIHDGALERASRTGSYRFLARASGERLPFRDGTFRAIIGNCVFEHIPDLRAAVSEAARVLCPGGLFILTVPSDGYTTSVPGYRVVNRISPRLAARLGAWYNRVGEQLHTLSRSAWESILLEAGLTPKTLIEYCSPRANRRRILLHYLFYYGRAEVFLYALGRACDLFGGGDRFRKALQRVERAWLGSDFRELETACPGGKGAEILIVAARGGA